MYNDSEQFESYIINMPFLLWKETLKSITLILKSLTNARLQNKNTLEI